MTIPLADRPTALYRLFGVDDLKLYIGIAANPPARWVTHAAQKTWWPEVVRTEITWYENRALAEEAEIKAIVAERPIHNVAHHPDASQGDGKTQKRQAVRGEREVTPEMTAAMDALIAAATKVRQHDGERLELADSIVFALTHGVRPVEVDAEVDYDRNHIRRIAKAAGVPALRGGHDDRSST